MGAGVTCGAHVAVAALTAKGAVVVRVGGLGVLDSWRGWGANHGPLFDGSGAAIFGVGNGAGFHNVKRVGFGCVVPGRWLRF